MPAAEPPDPAAEELAALARAPLDVLASRVEAWEQQGAAALPALLALEAEVRDAAARKRIRRALHRLRSAGIAAAPAAAPSAARSVLQPVDEGAEGALVAAPDAEGLQQIFAVLAGGARASRALELWLHGELGVRALHSVELPRAEGRKALRSAERTATGHWARVPLAEAAARVVRAQRSAGEPPPGVDADALGLLLRRAGPRTPGERLRERLAGAQALPRAESEATLAARLRADRIPPWRIGDPETWSALARELDSFQHSQIILSPAQQRERRDRAVREAWARVLGAGGREQLAERLDESGAVWWSKGDPAAARAALEVAARVRGEPDLELVAFARECFEASLRAAVSAAQAEQDGRLVVPA